MWTQNFDCGAKNLADEAGVTCSGGQPQAPGRNRVSAVGFSKSYLQECESRGYSSREETICPAHIDDATLKRAVEECATEPKCSYCAASNADGSPVAAMFDDFMEHFMVGVRNRHGRADDEGVPWDEGEYVAATIYDSWDVAAELWCEAALGDYPDEAQHEIGDHIAEAMRTESWVRRDWAWMPLDQQLIYSWDGFKELVKHQTRFLFIRSPGRRPEDPDELRPREMLEQIVEMLYERPETILAVETPLFRGRMCTEEPDLDEFGADQLGPAPIQKAGANRMSPAGISMFYGATDADTAVAEIAAHSSQSWAVVGEFTPVGSLRIGDLSNLPAQASIFDTDYHRSVFLQQFVTDLTLPVVLDGREHIDYVPTQILTEYLRYSFPEPLDGLQFPSAQGPGKNVVLFVGPGSCAESDRAEEHTRLILTAGSVRKYPVARVIKRSSPA